MMDKENKKTKFEKRRKEKLEELMRKISKEELTDLFRISISILGCYKKKQKAKEKVKIIKSFKKVLTLPVKFMCLIIGVSYSAFFKYSKEVKAIDKCYRRDKKTNKKKIMKIYLKSNRTFRILQALWNENIKISYKTV